MEQLQKLQQEIKKLKARNQKVDADKAWETSLSRKISIFLLTYFVIVLFFLIAEFPQPFLNALVPALGFFLSTLTLNFIKAFWLKRYGKK